MKIGIPRALLYYKNEKFWTTFFNEIGAEYIISPETNKEILTKGENLAIDETCLPTKLLLGHIDWLIGKCDCVFVPRVAYHRGYETCTKFLAQTDLVYNTFRDRDIKLLYYNVDDKKIYRERTAVMKMGKFLKVKRSQRKYAYIMAKQAQQFYETFREQNQEKIITENGKKLKYAKKYAKYNLGATANCTVAEAIKFAREGCAGIIQVKSFGCTPEIDAMPILRNVSKDFNIPILHFSFDSQTSETGVRTRLEAFYDMVEARN